MGDDPLRHLWLPYTQMQDFPLPPVAAETSGARIRLSDGRELIDGISSWWTACHGYCHPHITDAIRRQAETLPHVMFGGLLNDPAVTLAERLSALLPGDLNRVFFCDSGSVAVEVAMKMAVQVHRNRDDLKRSRFVAFNNAYHGDTMAAMSVTDPEEGMHGLFQGYLPQQIFADLPASPVQLQALDDLLAEKKDEIAAVIVEPLVQCAGGMKMHTPEVLAAVAAAAARHDLLLIVDEVATGFGRTGTMFASEAAGIAPDILCLGKALTGGAISLAATVATDAVFAAFLSDDPEKALMHGPTFMANPLACAAANASLDLFATEPRLDQVAAIETQMRDELEPFRPLPGVVDVRVTGAIGALQMTGLPAIDDLKARFLAEGVWIRPFGDVIYLMPPFVISPEDLKTLTATIGRVIPAWAAANGVQ